MSLFGILEELKDFITLLAIVVKEGNGRQVFMSMLERLEVENPIKPSKKRSLSVQSISSQEENGGMDTMEKIASSSMTSTDGLSMTKCSESVTSTPSKLKSKVASLNLSLSTSGLPVTKKLKSGIKKEMGPHSPLSDWDPSEEELIGTSLSQSLMEKE